MQIKIVANYKNPNSKEDRTALHRIAQLSVAQNNTEYITTMFYQIQAAWL